MSMKGNKKPASILPTIIVVLFGLIVVMLCYVFYLRAPHNLSNEITPKVVNVIPAFNSNAPAKFLRTVDPNVVFVNMTVSTSIGLGNVIIEINKEWAPLGAPRFVELVESHYFEDARFFRVIKVGFTDTQSFTQHNNLLLLCAGFYGSVWNPCGSHSDKAVARTDDPRRQSDSRQQTRHSVVRLLGPAHQSQSAVLQLRRELVSGQAGLCCDWSSFVRSGLFDLVVFSNIY
jgi:hypothetical protein